MRRLDEGQLNSLESQCREYEMGLTEAPEALSYLRGRGLSTSCVDRFRLGLVVDPPPEHKGANGRLVIPTLKRVGPIGFKFRCINPVCLAGGEDEENHDGHGKYMTFEPQSMFNVQALDNDRGYIAICEGEIDAMTLDGECDIPAVGLPGVNSWHDHYYGMLKEFSRIWIFSDNDTGKEKNVGAEFGRFLCEKFDQAVPVALPLDETAYSTDVNRVYRTLGSDVVRGLIGL